MGLDKVVELVLTDAGLLIKGVDGKSSKSNPEDK